MVQRNHQSLILLVAILLGWGWDVLFYGKALGISMLLFVGLVVAALFGLGWQQGLRPAQRNLWLLAPLFFMATMVFIRANSFVTFVNMVACLGLLGLMAHFYAAGQLERLGLLGYPLTLLQLLGNMLVRPGPLVSASVDLPTVRSRSQRNLLPLLRGLLLALPVLLVFTCLLASADLVFADYVQDVLHLGFLSDLLEWGWRGLVILMVAWLLAGGLIYACQRSADATGVLDKLPGQISRICSLGVIEVNVLLSLVNLLFLVFVWIQFAYLFGGQANITVEGYTYAEYARRGFFELVAVSILTLGLSLILQAIIRREPDRSPAGFRELSSLMVILVLVMLASAFQRLLLYEMAYGYTELRLYSHIFMIWLAATFGWFLLTLWLQPQRFAIGAFSATLGFVVTLNLINPDAFIARQNLAHLDEFLGPQSQSYARDNELDVDYLTTLSDDAVPALLAGLEQINPEKRAILADHLRSRRAQLAAELQVQPWPSYHLAQQQAYALLVGME
jgi:hypothetical protein